MPSPRWTRKYVQAMVVLVVLGLAASGTLWADAPDDGLSHLFWPAPPAEPRVFFIKNIPGHKDMEIKKNAFGRLKDFLVGRTETGFVHPMDVSVGEDGTIYTSDVGAAQVYIYDPGRKSLESIGRIDRGPDLVSPVGVAIAPNGTIFIADSCLGKVFAVNRKGQSFFVLGREQGLQRPTDVFVRQQKLYVVDGLACEVFIFDLKGKLIGRFGHKGKADGEFNVPTHIYVDRQNKIYVTDTLNFRVQVFDEKGQFVQSIGSAGDSSGHFSRPKGVAVDSYGHIYVVDALFDNVQIFDLDRNFLLNFGEAGHGDGEFWLPSGIAVDENNYIYVADSYNQRISVYKYVGAQ